MEDFNLLITEPWLSASGFRWHQLDRQPDKQWLLWLGSAIEDGLTAAEDLGVEVSRTGRPADGSEWHCWLRRIPQDAIAGLFIFDISPAEGT